MRPVRCRLGPSVFWIVLGALTCSVPRARAQSCQTLDDLDDATRSAITGAARRYFDMAVKGDAASLRQNSIPSLAGDFGVVEADVKEHQQDLSSAQTSPKAVYLLEAEGSAPLAHGEFYCGVFGKNGQTAGSAEFFLDNLQPGKYAIVILDAASPKGHTNFSLVLQQTGSDWKLGNLKIKSLQVAGHDSGWFAARAREYKTKGQVHNAWLYYLEANSLISPLPFMSTQATDRLYDEFQGVQPADIPSNGKTADLAAGTTTYKLTSLFPAAVGDDLDLILKYQAADVSDTNAAYQTNVAVIKALAAKFPELRDAFAAVVARAVDPSGHDFGTLLAMKDIK